jgi:sugar (pentulose or hexulose) kinase
MVELAEKIKPGCDNLVAKPCPNQYPGLEGFENITPEHTPGHFARAIMESIVVTLAELVDDIYPQARPQKIVATGGGAKSDLWLQMKADKLAIELVRTKCQEPACMGAGMLAAVAAGWVANVAQAEEAWLEIDSIFTPTT